MADPSAAAERVPARGVGIGECEGGRSMSEGIASILQHQRELELANNELRNLLSEAMALLSRGVACLDRTGWETGETDDEWKLAARKWLEQQKLQRKLNA